MVGLRPLAQRLVAAGRAALGPKASARGVMAAGSFAGALVFVGVLAFTGGGEKLAPNAPPGVDLAMPKPLPARTAAAAPGGGEAAAEPTTPLALPVAPLTVAAVTPAAFAGLSPRSGQPLPQAPQADLIEMRNGRALPRVAHDGREPWTVYARPFDRGDDRARIAIVITGLGLSPTATSAVIHYLPADFTLVFEAYGENVAAWAAEARAAGHETMLALPMQSTDFPFVDAGPQALGASLRGDEARQKLDYLLGLFPGYIGVASQPGGKLLQSRESMRPLLLELKLRGLIYFESEPAARGTTLAAAADAGTVRVAADVRLDEELAEAEIDERLARLENLARARFVAVGVARPRPVVVQRLALWMERLNPNDFVLAPLSAVAMMTPR